MQMSGPFSHDLGRCQLVLSVVLILVGLNLIANLRLLGRTAPRGAGPRSRRLVSVLIPARDEARNIERCLRSVLGQSYAPAEVLVLDDHSADETAQVVQTIASADGRSQLVPGEPLPQGWLGKSYGCHQLATRASGDWLVFTDADTDHDPTILGWAIEAAEQNQADLVSMIPRPVMHTLGEQLLLPIIPFGLAALYPLALTQRLGISSFGMAVGTYLLFDKKAYQRTGGHAAVRGEIAEDVALAGLVQRSGGRAVLLDGSDKLSVHFYQGFRESWHGLAKSAFAALRFRLSLSLLMIGVYGFLFLWPVLIFWLGLRAGSVEAQATRLAGLHVLLNAGLWYAVAARFRIPRTTALIYPVTVLLTILMMADSIRRAAVGGIGWKRRVYDARGGELRH
jgi:chlorobactene glucosyltransferase